MPCFTSEDVGKGREDALPKTATLSGLSGNVADSETLFLLLTFRVYSYVYKESDEKVAILVNGRYQTVI